MGYGVGCRHGSDPVLLLLWLSLWLAAAALIQPLVWEFPYMGTCSPKKQKQQQQNKN